MKRIIQCLAKWSHRQRALALVIACMVLLSGIGASYAAYVSRSYVKGVAASPQQALSMSSDCLGAVSQLVQKANYPVKRILLDKRSDTDNTPYSITFYIENTSNGTVSTKRIEYLISIKGLTDEAGALQDGIKLYLNDSELSGENLTSILSDAGYRPDAMPAYTRTNHLYRIEIPKNKIDSVTDIVVIAVPTEQSDSSGNMLAARIQPSTVGTIAKFSYAGSFPDQTGSNHPYDFAAFNYDISVTSATGDHTMLLTWDNTRLEIDPEFEQSIAGDISNSGSLEITMNGENNHYLIKFYRLVGRNNDTTLSSNSWQTDWEEMKQLISFTEKAD